jgi:hypothetical protein
VAAIALLTIAAYALDYDLGIDELLFADPTTPAALYPGRPAPTTAWLFLLISSALLLFRASRNWIHLVVDLLAGAIMAAAYLAVIGYLMMRRPSIPCPDIPRWRCIPRWRISCSVPVSF